jgi:hypothetical protein
MGIGSGILFQTLTKTPHSIEEIFLFEPIQELNQDIDWKKEIEDLIPKTIKFQWIDSWNEWQNSHLPQIILPFHQRTFSKEIKEYSSSIFQSTVQHFEKLWTRNYFINTKRLYNKFSFIQNFPISEAKKDHCVYLGASPILEEQISHLKKWREKAFWICSDTSLRYLLSQELIPDAILSVDPGRGTLYHFPFGSYEDIPLFTWLGGNPKVIESSKNVYLFLTTYPLDQSLLASLSSSKDWILENPSQNSAGMAIGIADALGFSSIHLAGFSMVSQEGKSHCRETGYTAFYLPTFHRKFGLEMVANQGYQSKSKGKNQKSWEAIQSLKKTSKIWIEDKEMETLPEGKTIRKKVLYPSIPSLQVPLWLKLSNQILPTDGIDSISFRKHSLGLF